MSTPSRIFVVIVALVILTVVIRLAGTRRLRSKYALLWLTLAIPTVLFALVPSIVDWFADRLGVEDAPALLLTMACAVLLLIVMQFSWELSRLEERTRRLAEETALLRTRLRELEEADDA